MHLIPQSVPVGPMVRGHSNLSEDPFSAFKSLEGGSALCIAGAILHYGHAGHPNGRLLGCFHSLLTCLMAHKAVLVRKKMMLQIGRYSRGTCCCLTWVVSTTGEYSDMQLARQSTLGGPTSNATACHPHAVCTTVLKHCAPVHPCPHLIIFSTKQTAVTSWSG